MKKYNMIDVCKIIMALCVVAIHTSPLHNCTNELANSIYDAFVNLAVPFFFLASGFLLSNKLDYPFSDKKDIGYIKQYLFRIIKLYLLWTLIYLPLAVYYFISEGMGLVKSILLYIRGEVFVGEQYNSFQLWYLLATIYALILVIILLKYVHLNPKKIVMVGTVLFVISIAITYLAQYKGDVKLPEVLCLIQKLIVHSISTGRILFGTFYIPVGMLLAKKKFNIKIALPMFVISYVLNVIVHNTAISLLLVATSAIGLFVVVKEIRLPDCPMYFFIRKMSTVIYFIHMYVWTIYYMIIYGEKTYGMDSFVVVSIVSMVLAICYIIFSNRLKKAKKH